VLVVVVVAAGCLTVGYVVNRPSTAPYSKADGPTFYQALGALNSSVTVTSGGPWTLFAVWGIATTLPLAPGALGWPEYNLSENACQAQFNGLTLWNGSIPLFNGTFNSGTAPFWQFAFFSNASSSILIATDVLGVAHVYAPMSESSPCADGTSLGGDPWTWQIVVLPSLPWPTDTPKLAQTAWIRGGGKGWTNHNPPAFEAYDFGFSYWGSANPAGLIVKYSRCGLVGATDVQPVLYVGLNPDASWGMSFNGSQGCGDVQALGPPPVLFGYAAVFSTATVSGTANTSLAAIPFQLGPLGDPSGDYDVSGLVSWMTTLNLTDSAGQRLQSGTPGCPAWVPSIADCTASAAGWYVVLESESGAWLDSYPSTPGGTSWEVPNVAFASHQQLVVVAPSTWNLTGDELALNGTVAACPVNGTAMI